MKFKSDIEVQAGLKDSSGSAGTSGQILSSTASGVSWINQISLSGYVPYTGATTNVDLGTHTLLAKDLVINHSSGSGVAASITKGGSGEALTINKTSGSGNAMSVTGGLTSLVDLTLSSIANATIDTDKFLVSDSSTVKYRTGAQVLSDIGGQAALTNPITGTGTTNYVSKFTGATTLGNSQIFDNGTNVGIGTTGPTAKLDVAGVIRGVLSDPAGTGGVTAKILSYSPSPYGLVFRSYSSGAHSIQSQREANDAQMYPLSLQPNGGNVGIGTTSPTALLTVSGDALINSITVGRGGGNDNSNTVVGRNSFTYNSSGTENTVVGANAGNSISTGNANVIIGKIAGSNINGGSGNTIIGTNNSLPPTTAPTDFSDTLSISKGESNFGVNLPHIWAPANVATSSTATIISANVGAYRAMFVEYVIEDESGNIRGGYIKGIWNSDLSVIKMTEDATSSIGVTSNYIFDIVDDGSSNAALQITSLSTDIVYCAVTSRLLTRVY